jgi:hypothetical protein
MYVCPKCNSLVGQPKRRWWSSRQYCANGHVLYVRGLGPSLEQPFQKSFLRAFARAMIIFSIIAITLAIEPDNPRELLERHAKTQAPAAVGFLLAIYYLLGGLNMLRKARIGARQAGPVQKLVAHARGRAYGFLAAVLCQLGVAVALLFAR